MIIINDNLNWNLVLNYFLMQWEKTRELNFSLNFKIKVKSRIEECV